MHIHVYMIILLSLQVAISSHPTKELHPSVLHRTLSRTLSATTTLFVQSFDDINTSGDKSLTSSASSSASFRNNDISASTSRRHLVDSEPPDFYLFQPYDPDYVHFGLSMSTDSDFFSWSQNRYAWVTNNPTDVSDISSSQVAQYEADVSHLTGEIKRPEESLPWQNYLSSLYENNVLWAGGRGAMVMTMTADSNYRQRHRIAQAGSPLTNIDLRIVACAMGNANWFVLSGYVL